METVMRKLDFELCKSILLWLEARLDQDSMDMFEFDQHTMEDTFHNTKKLFNSGFILVRGPTKYERGTTGYWPTEFTPLGRQFMEVVKDDKRWKKAVKAAKQNSDTATLGPLKAALFKNL